jgi:hypothetical protein
MSASRATCVMPGVSSQRHQSAGLSCICLQYIAEHSANRITELLARVEQVKSASNLPPEKSSLFLSRCPHQARNRSSSASALYSAGCCAIWRASNEQQMALLISIEGPDASAPASVRRIRTNFKRCRRQKWNVALRTKSGSLTNLASRQA